jgi:hypothetical protein
MVDLTVVKQHFGEGCPTWIDCGKGWYQLILDTHNKIVELDPNYTIQQIKEKYGGLRFYHTSCHQFATWDIEEAAEVESYTICEVCGRPGSLRGRAWLQTTCDEHSP